MGITTRIDKRYLSESELKILAKVVNDPFLFSTFVWVIHPIKGKVKFALYPFQKKVLWYFLMGRFNIVLKFRQAGLTELIAMYCLWLAMYHNNKSIQIISIKETVAKKVLRRIKFVYKNLPSYLQVPIINGTSRTSFGTTTEIEFANGSTITSIPTTEDAGRSEALSLLVIDEAAIIKWANQIWAAAFPTLSTGGSAILNSTPYGVGNFFHKSWVDAMAGGNPFTPIRLKWDMHPDRDINWYNTMKSALGAKRTAQEIDGDFLSSGDTVFDLADIKAIEDLLPEYPVIETRMNGSLHIFKKAQRGATYYLGADVASGRARDYSAFTIMDRYGEEMAVFKGKVTTDRYGDILMKIGYDYNMAQIGCEANDIGLSVVDQIQRAGYANTYFSTEVLREKGEARAKKKRIPGWLTTKKNRPVIIDELEEDIRNNNIIVKDQFFCQEAYTFIYNEQNKPIALGKDKSSKESTEDLLEDDNTYTDDSIMAKAICNYIRKGRASTVVVAPQ